MSTRLKSVTQVTGQDLGLEAENFLHRATLQLTATLELEQVFKNIAELAIPAFGDFCLVHLVDAEGAIAQVAEAAIADDLLADVAKLRAFRLRPGEGNIGRAVATHARVLVDSLPESYYLGLEEPLRSAVRAVSVRSALVVPMLGESGAVGALSLGAMGRTWSAQELAVLDELAKRAATAVTNARLLARARATAQRLDRLQRLAGELGHALRPSEVRQVVLQQAMSSLSASSAGLFELEPGGQAARLAAQVGYSAAHLHDFARVELDRSLPLAESLRTSQDLFLSGRAGYGDRYRELAGERLRREAENVSSACLLLRADGQVLGALALSFDDVRSFDPEEREFLRAVAAHCAQALQRARLYEEAQAAREAAERHAHLQKALLEASPLAVMVLDLRAVVRLWSPAAEEIFGWSEAEVLGRELPGLTAEERPRLLEALRAAAAGESLHVRDAPLRRRDGSPFEATLWAARLLDADGQPLCLGLVADQTERLRAERGLQLLARASDLLSSPLELDATLEHVARLAVPEFADWVFVDLLQPDGQLRRIAAHADPAKEPLATRLRRTYPARAEVGPGVSQVLRSGRSTGVVEITPAFRDAVARDAAHRKTLDELGGYWAFWVPLRLGERVLGTMAWINTRPVRFTEDDVRLAEELARRAAMAVDRVRLFDDAQLARRRSEEALRHKDEFLATMSHELRTPLTAILGYANLLRKGAIAEDRKERALEVIERNAKAQAQLVSDLLDFSRIATGKLRLEVKMLVPAKVIEAAVDSVRLAAEAKGIALAVEISPSAPLIAGDADRLQQVVWNLLTNAIKFTPRGGHVRLHLRGENDEAVLTIEDDGEGIPAEFLPHLFQRFRQADASAKRQHGGLGLGLSLVRHLLEMHGGTVNAHSDGPGSGARFEVRLPAMRNADLRASPGRAPPARLDGVHVLLVEDDADAREMLTSALEVQGARVTAATSAVEGLQKLSQITPSIIVSDLGMPGDDGCTFLRQVRSLPLEEGGGVPALALSAYARAEDRERALQAGFQRHLAKPVDPAELVAQVAALLPS